MSWGIRPDQCEGYEAPSPLDWDAPVGHIPSIHREPSGMRGASLQDKGNPWPMKRYYDIPWTPRADMTQPPLELCCEVFAGQLTEALITRISNHPHLAPFPRAHMPDQILRLECHHYLAIRAGLILRCRVAYCANTEAYFFHYNDGFHTCHEVLL